MGTLQETTFTSAAGVTYSNYAKIGLPTAGRNHASQVVSASAISNTATGTATLTLILYDDNDPVDPVKRRYNAAVAIAGGPIRTNAAGTGGGYLCTVAFTASTNEKQDIIPGDPPKGMSWRWGLSALATITSLKVLLAYDEVI